MSKTSSATLSALVVCKNEEDFIYGCLQRLAPFCDEIIVVDNGSTDRTKEIARQWTKKVYDYPETINMAEVRNFSLSKATGDWILQVDADEYYPPEAMLIIRGFIEHADEHGYISARVKYKNLAWREGYAQKDFGHYPDRIYRRDVIDCYHGVLPIDETRVKREFLLYPDKKQGNPVLEYDHPEDKSHVHPKQPIIDATYYHLARTRGHWFERKKWYNYNKNIHPNKSEEELKELTKINAWVSGLYEMEKIDIPDGIPTKTIKSPKVSVIVTCHNKGQWIEECLDSILNQTHKPYEVIVVDDGSQDTSHSILEGYALGGQIKLRTQENQGVVRARNNGLDMATGDYFVLIDGDDKLKPNFIERCLQEMKGDVQIVSTDFEGLGEWEGRIHKYPHPFSVEQLKQAQTFPSVMALYDMRLRSPFGNFQNFIFEDYAWYLELVLRRGANVVHIPEPLCYYRRTTGTRCDQADNEKAKEELRKEFKINPL